MGAATLAKKVGGMSRMLGEIQKQANDEKERKFNNLLKRADCKIQKFAGGTFGSLGRKADRKREKEEGDSSPVTNMLRKSGQNQKKSKITRINSETIIDSSKQKTKTIMSGLNTPMINKIFNLSGGFLYKTSTGFYKQGQINLFNSELYLYQEPEQALNA